MLLQVVQEAAPVHLLSSIAKYWRADLRVRVVCMPVRFNGHMRHYLCAAAGGARRCASALVEQQPGNIAAMGQSVSALRGGSNRSPGALLSLHASSDILCSPCLQQ